MLEVCYSLSKCLNNPATTARATVRSSVGLFSWDFDLMYGNALPISIQQLYFLTTICLLTLYSPLQLDSILKTTVPDDELGTESPTPRAEPPSPSTTPTISGAQAEDVYVGREPHPPQLIPPRKNSTGVLRYQTHSLIDGHVGLDSVIESSSLEDSPRADDVKNTEEQKKRQRNRQRESLESRKDVFRSAYSSEFDDTDTSSTTESELSSLDSPVAFSRATGFGGLQPITVSTKHSPCLKKALLTERVWMNETGISSLDTLVHKLDNAHRDMYETHLTVIYIIVP